MDFGGTDETPTAIALDINSLILLAGTSTQERHGKDFALARLNRDGTPDTNFGHYDGMVTTDFGGDDEAGAMAIQPDNGRIILAGYTNAWDADNFAIARYGADGSLDRGL